MSQQPSTDPDRSSGVAVDIMMPFYGDVALFKAAVASVLQQSGRWRLVVVDDGYPDPEPARFMAALDDPRVEYLVNKHNLGISGNFQRCVDLASADLTVIMGCDDLLLPGYVERLIDLADRYPGADYIQSGVETIDESGRRTRPLGDRIKAALRPNGTPPRSLRGEYLAASLLRGDWTYFPSIGWRTATIKKHGFRPDLQIVLDLDLKLSIAAGGGELVVDDEVTFRYRRHRASASSWSSADDRRFAEEKQLFTESAARMRKLGWRRAERIARSHLVSRLNAAVQLPRAVLTGEHAGLRPLLAHVFGRIKR